MALETFIQNGLMEVLQIRNSEFTWRNAGEKA